MIQLFFRLPWQIPTVLLAVFSSNPNELYTRVAAKLGAIIQV
jgi:hypothetical protein